MARQRVELGLGAVFRRAVLALCHGLARVSRRSQSVILMYHSVGALRKDLTLPGLGVPADVFEGQARFVRRVGAIALEHVPRHLARKRAGTRIAITFDDYYRDNYSLAWPILKRLGLPATFFVATRYVEEGTIGWWDRLAWLVNHANSSEIELRGTRYPLRDAAERARFMRIATQELLALETLRHREEEVKALAERQGVQMPDNAVLFDWILRWSDIREMSSEGADFGAHSHTHDNLARIGRTAARREIVHSRDVLRERTGQPVRVLSYPNGDRTDFDDTVKSLAREEGFACAVTTLPGVNDAATDLYELRRVMPAGELRGQDFELWLLKWILSTRPLARRLLSIAEGGVCTAISRGVAGHWHRRRMRRRKNAGVATREP